MKTGAWNSKWSTAAVTQFLPECRIATTPAAESASFMIFPPWTFPAGFASCGVISCAITSRVADTGFASAVIVSSSYSSPVPAGPGGRSARDQGVVFLEAPDRSVTLPVRGDSHGGSDGRRRSGDVGNLVLDGRFSYVGVVVNAGLPGRRVDDQVDLPVLDGVSDVGAPLVHLQD